jgi:NADH-quinone oxidoreductase subunit H
MYNLYLNIFNKLGLPEILAQLSWPLIPFIGVAALLVIVVLFLVLMERKILALFTVRKGPNRVGPFGLFQTIADAIKLLIKEDIMSSEVNKLLFTIAPVIVFVPTMLIYCLLPFAGNLLAVNIAAGLFLILAVSSISTVGIVIAGWASNNKYSLLGGMRSAAQAISYEIPLMLSAISVAILAGSMNVIDIVEKQSSGIFFWNAVPSVIGFAVFFICSIAEVNRIPFDLPEAESELVSGYNTEYSGMKFALFFLAEYAALFIVSVLTVTLFLGGYTSPLGVYISKYISDPLFHNQIVTNLFISLEQGFWLVFKTYIVIFAIMWIRATLPRLKADQLMAFSWKFLLPLSLINIVIVSVYRYFIPG